MPQPRKPAATVDTTTAQEGSRWIGARPDPKDVAKWFRENVRLHDGMTHEPYLPGITLITSTEKMKVIKDNAIIEVERLVHVPYAKVETRIAYFWDLCTLRDWLGVIEPGHAPKVRAQNMMNEHLPPGFFRIPVQTDTGQFTHFVACTMKCSVYQPDLRSGGRGRMVLDPPPATKMIALVNRYKDADPFALMKAETGAVGRALGMAGMLAMPGSGVATAEDMQEVYGDAKGASVSDAQLPDDQPESDGMEAKIGEHFKLLMEEAPGRMDTVREWAQAREIDLDSPKPTQLRALLGALEKQVAEMGE